MTIGVAAVVEEKSDDDNTENNKDDKKVYLLMNGRWKYSWWWRKSCGNNSSVNKALCNKVFMMHLRKCFEIKMHMFYSTKEEHKVWYIVKDVVRELTLYNNLEKTYKTVGIGREYGKNNVD